MSSPSPSPSPSPSSTPVPEAQVPSSYDLSFDGLLPQRQLHHFSVSRLSHPASICALDEASSTSAPLILHGHVRSPQGRLLPTVSQPLLEWCIEYSPSPSLWLRSKTVWYKLVAPHKSYVQVHDLARRRFELCARIFILLTTLAPHESTFKGLAHLLACPYRDMRPYSEKDILLEKAFILAQFRTLDDPAIANSAFIRELARKPLPKKPKKEATPLSTPAHHTMPMPSGSSHHASTPASPPSNQWRPPVDVLDADASAKLLKRVHKALGAISKSRTAYPFRQPVDPNADGCPDYLVRIQTPMDYGTIKSNLDNNRYASPAQVLDDVRLVTSNCVEYNSFDHEYSKWACALENRFETLVHNAYDAELAAMNKRQAVAKKRGPSSSSVDAASGPAKKAARGPARRGSKSSLDLSPSAASTPKDDESLDLAANSPPAMCARSSDQMCDKASAPRSKYCSDACGLIVARKRLDEITKSGCDPEAYINAYITKVVYSRS